MHFASLCRVNLGLLRCCLQINFCQKWVCLKIVGYLHVIETHQSAINFLLDLRTVTRRGMLIFCRVPRVATGSRERAYTPETRLIMRPSQVSSQCVEVGFMNKSPPKSA